MADQKLKELIDNTEETVSLVAKHAGYDQELGKALKKDIAAYLVFLSLQDGSAVRAELSEISELCDMELNGDNLEDFLEEKDIAARSYSYTVPESFETLVNLEKQLEEREGFESITSAVIETYKQLGESLANADGKVSMGEAQGYLAYVNILQDYVRDFGTL